jgi:hypothetical protein
MPEPACSAPQGEREKGDYGSRQRGNRAIVFVREVASAGDIQAELYDRAADNGATFVKGFIGLPVLALVYAVLKRL